MDEVLRNSQSDADRGRTGRWQAGSWPYPDPVSAALASYMRIWIRHAQGKAERLRALNHPPGAVESRWTVPDELAGMIASDDPDLVCLPGERFIFRWLTEIKPGDLSSDALAGRVRDAHPARAEIPKLVEARRKSNSWEYRHIGGAARRWTRPGSVREGFVGTIAETLEARGEARGIAKGEALGIAKGEALGIAKGRAEGRKQDLIRLLERRFGPLPQAARKRIADADQLDGWIDRVLDATSLEAALGDG